MHRQSNDYGLSRANTLLLDLPYIYQAYQPRNYDSRFDGEITAAQALQDSLNLQALEIMRALEPQNFYEHLNQFSNALPPYYLNLSYSEQARHFYQPHLVLARNATPSLGLVLGGVSISLYDLTQYYAALAHDGAIAPLRFTPIASSNPAALAHATLHAAPATPATSAVVPATSADATNQAATATLATLAAAPATLANQAAATKANSSGAAALRPQLHPILQGHSPFFKFNAREGNLPPPFS